jgi:hypothetical protein
MLVTNEIISEPSLKFNTSMKNFSFCQEVREPVIKCIENLDERINLYEREIEKTKEEFSKSKKGILIEELSKNHSPGKTRIISSNAGDKSFNLIEKISRTSDTDKSFSSTSH